MILHVDLETRSPVNLLTAGSKKYAAQAEIICMRYAFDDGEIGSWDPILNPGEPFPTAVTEHFITGGICYAHNAEFEKDIFEAVMPEVAPEPWQWTCTANMARACALPGRLGQLCVALGTQTQKQAEGLALIKQLCIPRADGSYDESRDALVKMGDYCTDDVRTERECATCLRALTDDENDDYLVNVLINDRGIPVDLELAKLAQQYAEDEKDDLMKQLEVASGGDLSKTSGVKLTNWVYESIQPEHRLLMEREVDGELKRTLDKRTRFELLALTDLDPDLRTVLECCDLASKSSVSKFKRMQERALDGRVYGAYLANGAGQTGRFSSIGLQVHNLPRASVEFPEEVIQNMRDGIPLVDTMTVLSHLLRQSICAPDGKWFVWSDLSAIEGRVLPWLAKSLVADNKLHLFKTGQDIYVHTAAEMFNLNLAHVNDTLRQQGKIAELSLGFAGGAGALKAMARNYGVVFTDQEAEDIKTRWRDANAWAPLFWAGVEAAALRAIDNPETLQPVGRLKYLYTPGVLHNALWCILPSGRPLCYPAVRTEMVDSPWGEQRVITGLKASLQPKKGETEWPRQRIWKGLLAENATQAAAADVLRGALRELVLEHNAPVCAHTHDEIVLEVDEPDVEHWTEVLNATLTKVPAWAEGLPLACKGDDGYRYSK